jgi:ligand-binding sensor domain-containing protein
MRFVFCILFTINCYLCVAQGSSGSPVFDFKDITTKEHISNKIINCITQDKIGLIWVATKDGLNRLDGYRTKQFYYDPLEKNH